MSSPAAANPAAPSPSSATTPSAPSAPTSPATRSTDRIGTVIARTSPDPDLLKPCPHLLHQAITASDADPAECALVGDSAHRHRSRPPSRNPQHRLRQQARQDRQPSPTPAQTPSSPASPRSPSPSEHTRCRIKPYMIKAARSRRRGPASRRRALPWEARPARTRPPAGQQRIGSLLVSAAPGTGHLPRLSIVRLAATASRRPAGRRMRSATPILRLW